MGPIDPASIAMLRDAIGGVGSAGDSAPSVGDAGSGASEFGTTLASMMKDTVAKDASADKAVSDFAGGKQMDLHDTLMTMEKGDISLKFMVNVRNKVVDAYKEIMRMGG